MSKSEHSKDISKIFGSIKIYKDAKQDWVQIVPPELGDIKFSVQSNDHNGWLKCDGRAVSRITYADLFATIGISFGAGNGTTTFNLPDARGRVIGAIGTGSGLTARSLGHKEGTETHTLTIDEMPSHNHDVTDPGHTHSYTNTPNDQQVSALLGEQAADQADFSQTTGSSTTGITIQNTGGGGAHNNMQPTLFAANVFIFGVHQI
jgi:microcystin-dependent protein